VKPPVWTTLASGRKKSRADIAGRVERPAGADTRRDFRKRSEEVLERGRRRPCRPHHLHCSELCHEPSEASRKSSLFVQRRRTDRGRLEKRDVFDAAKGSLCKRNRLRRRNPIAKPRLCRGD
jgi:hypothetical protein